MSALDRRVKRLEGKPATAFLSPEAVIWLGYPADAKIPDTSTGTEWSAEAMLWLGKS